MGFGNNLQWLRKMYNGMTQEELAEKMGVARQTISRWELDAAYPEITKALELCQLFSCFEKEYEQNGTTYMDIYIAIKN